MTNRPNDAIEIVLTVRHKTHTGLLIHSGKVIRLISLLLQEIMKKRNKTVQYQQVEEYPMYKSQGVN